MSSFPPPVVRAESQRPLKCLKCLQRLVGVISAEALVARFQVAAAVAPWEVEASAADEDAAQA